MNFFHTGFKAVSRRLRRQKNRLALGHAHGALERVEIALGRICWRRLEGSEDTAAHGAVATLRLLEGELAENAAHVVALEEKIKAQETERETARRETQEALAKLEEERRPVVQQEKEAQARLSEQSAALREYDRHTAELDAEQLSLLREHAQMHVEAGVRAAGAEEEGRERADAARAREMRRREIAGRRAALPEEVARQKAGRGAVAESLKGMDTALREVRARLAELDRRAVETRASLAGREKTITAAVATLNREIATTRRQAHRIEEAKEEPFRQAGVVLADHDPQPEGAEAARLFEEVARQRQAVRSLEELEANWRQESEAANRQDLRIFHFTWVSGCVVLALSLLLVFRAPPLREYLPEDTEAVVSLNVDRFARGDLSQALQQQEPDVWQQLWAGLVRRVAEVPEIDLDTQVARITRAMVPNDTRDYLLVELHHTADVDALTRTLSRRAPYTLGYVDGVGQYVRWNGKEEGPALARIGPKTLALGNRETVEQLIHVRLGRAADMKVDTQFLNEFARLDQDSALRVLTARPERLRGLTDPILSTALLDRERCDLLGLAVDLEPSRPVSARFLLRGTSVAQALSIANFLRASPELALQLEAAGPNLFIEPPAVEQHGQGVEWRFRMTSPAAKEFLERVSRLGLTGGEKPLAMTTETAGR